MCCPAPTDGLHGTETVLRSTPPRAKFLSAKRRAEIAKKAAAARWGKKKAD